MSSVFDQIFGLSRDRPILQSEAAECGLACLAMVAAHFGQKHDLRRLRSQYGVSIKGATLKALMAAADGLGLAPRALRMELSHLQNAALPAILHWDMNHFVVLMAVKRNGFVIHDPGRGRVLVSHDEMSKHFTGVGLELQPTSRFLKKDETTPARLSDFWTRITGLKRSIIQALILSAIIQAFAVTAPLYQQMVIDDVITKQDLDLLSVLAIGFALMGVINIAITQLRARLMLYFNNALSFQMTTNLFRHLMRLPIDFFEKRHIGDITSRMSSLAPIQAVFTDSIVAIVLDSLMAIATLAMALIYSVKMTMIVIGLLLLGFVIELVLFPIRKRKQEEILHFGAKEQSTYLETIRSARAIKIFGEEANREAQWLNARADTLNEKLWLARFELNVGLFTGVLGVAINIMTLYLSAQLVITGEMTLGMLMAYQSYSGQFTGRVQALFGQVMTFRMLSLHLIRLADIVQEEPEITPADQQTVVMGGARRFSGKIELRGVSFRYGEGEPWILRDVNIIISAGEMLAITGPSGAGKTTLVKLLIGLLKPSEGEILVDDIPLTAVGVQAWRANLGVVMQDDQLLAGSLADNIAFFDTEMDMARIEQAAKAAHVHNDILKNPMGYNSLVGDMGASLSGGQQQRVMIARALYRDPSILFLDEGTANLDGQTEHAIVAQVRAMPITRIVIAHRPALIEAADRVLWVDQASVHDITDHTRKQAPVDQQAVSQHAAEIKSMPIYGFIGPSFIGPGFIGPSSITGDTE